MSFGLIVCFAIVLATFAFAVTLHQNKYRQREESIPALNALIIFWSLVGAFFLFAGLRTLAAYGNFIGVVLGFFSYFSESFDMKLEMMDKRRSSVTIYRERSKTFLLQKHHTWIFEVSQGTLCPIPLNWGRWSRKHTRKRAK